MAGKVQTAAGPSGQMRRPAGNGERMEQQMPFFHIHRHRYVQTFLL